MKQIQFAEINIEILIFKKHCSATSYVAATFHPTIGQYAHQYLSNTATPKLGMISSRNKGTLEDSYIAKGATKLSQANEQMGLSGYKGAGKVDC